MKFYKQIDLSKIKVLSFDLDNTLYDCQSVLTRAENWFTTYLCDRYGLGGKYQSYDYWANVKSKVLHEDMSLEDAHELTCIVKHFLHIFILPSGAYFSVFFDI